jgi:hypothetical protein
MRRSAVLVSVVTVAALIAASAKGIIGGQLDGSRHPGVGFMIAYDEAGQSFGGCSGTLVTQTLFVTAAHCPGGDPGFEPASVRIVFVPQVPVDSDGVPIDPSKFLAGTPIPNPAYSDDGDGFLTFEEIGTDFGVVVLDHSANKVFRDVKLSTLPSADFFEGAVKGHL